MKKEKLLEYYGEKLRLLKRSMSHIITCPQGVPIKFKYFTWKHVNGKYEKGTQYIAAVIKTYNSESFRVELIAKEDAKGYFGSPKSKNPNMTVLKFQYIEDWELIDKDDLPLLVGYEQTYPLLEKLFNKGS
jgi:hypothetical protein